jgi:8-oxo-dGTP diphosphatase
MLDDSHHRLGVAGVVLNAAGQILLIRTEQAGWELPGGRVEQGENLITALKREVQEETACNVSVGRLASLSMGASGLVVFTFVCTHTGGDPRPGDDSLEATWCTAEEALRLVTHRAERARLGDGLAGTSGVIYRVYGIDAGGAATQIEQIVI